MIEALKSDAIVDKMGGRFKLCALIQRRLVQLMDGARPLVERGDRSDLELAIEEILQNKIGYEFDPTSDADIASCLPPDQARAFRAQKSLK
ncbi:MAG: DNA-directed RNA polymerase subunit omega [Phycisphaerales bacterium]|nr:DNA-directed RNA polymerase subunit omega [Phycisphaerales bacterium]